MQVADTLVNSRQMGILSNEPATSNTVITATEASRLILVAGKPLREPIVQYGPFVMNTQAEIHQALDDYQRGNFI